SGACRWPAPPATGTDGSLLRCGICSTRRAMPVARLLQAPDVQSARFCGILAPSAESEGTPRGESAMSRPDVPVEEIWPNDVLAQGTLLHGYRITRILGRGGFGVTYLGEDLLGQDF